LQKKTIKKLVLLNVSNFKCTQFNTNTMWYGENKQLAANADI